MRSLARVRKPSRRFKLESLERRDLLAADLQIIHNSPYDAAAVVDVYVNDALLLNDVAFRDATPYLSVPSGVDLKIDITGGAAVDNSAPVFTTTVNLAADTNYIAIATGDPSAAVGPTAFFLAVTDIGRQAAVDPALVDVLVFHGAPDAPTVDVIARDVGTLIDDISYPEFAADYLSVPAANYTIDITLADGEVNVRSFAADLSGAAGAAAVVLASGFVVPPTNTSEDFGLLAVLPDGTSFLLPVVEASVPGTNGTDAYYAQLSESNPAVLEVEFDGQTYKYLTLTNDVVNLNAQRGRDVIVATYPDHTSLFVPTLNLVTDDGGDRLYLYAGNGADAIEIDEGQGFVVNINGNLILADNFRAIYVWGKGGDDTIDGIDVFTVGLKLFGNRGNDTIYGGWRGDIIDGGWGNDALYGFGGNDIIYGNDGRDFLSGGRGDYDVLIGGLGADSYEDLIFGIRRRWREPA